MSTFSTNSTVFAASISTFLRSLSAQLTTAETRIATTKRVNTMRDDPVAYIQSERLTQSASALRSVIKDDLDRAVGIFEVATSTMDQLRDYYDQLTDLALDSASASPSQNRSILDGLFEQIKTDMTTLINGALYDGTAVLSGAYSSGNGGADLQVLFTTDPSQKVTARVDYVSVSVLGVGALDISTQVNAQAAHTSLTTEGGGGALAQLNYRDSRLNQRLETLEQYRDYAAVQAANFEAAATSMTEADTVWEVARQTALQVQQQAAISVLAQGNIRATYVLNLFPNLTNWA